MAEQPVIHIRENSPKHVAFKPMEMIANVENVALSCSTDRDRTSATREWSLNTYNDCILTVSTRRSVLPRVAVRILTHVVGKRGSNGMSRCRAEWVRRFTLNPYLGVWMLRVRHWIDIGHWRI